MLETNKIHHGDCLELMWQIEDHSIDMVLADLPYGTTACAWDSIIPLEPLWAHYKRIIKPRGAIVLTASQPFTTDLINSARSWFKYELIWNKIQSTGFQMAKFTPMKSHENILIFGNGTITYNPQMTEKDVPLNTINWKSTGKTTLLGGLNNPEARKKILTHSYPKSVFTYNSKNAETNNLRSIHPTQKPVALFAYLIRTYTNPGDLVLDNAAGSGTTAIAAIDTGRNWLLIEKDPEYYQIAKDRIAERLKQPFLPGLGGTAHNKQLYPNCYPSAPEQLSLIDKPEAD